MSTHCETPTELTPETIYNRPGLPAIRYRVGTFGSLREAMIRGIARKPELRRWTARDNDDYGIALLEMWAVIGDILTFYQERTANEAFLGTARLRENVLRMAALIGYRPAPGAAAETYLAFTLDKSAQVEIPAGLQVQSVPDEGEKPQLFETAQAIQADAALNGIPVYARPDYHSALQAGSSHGVLTPDGERDLAPGDRLVLVATDATVEEKTVVRLVPPAGNSWQTTLRWDPANSATGSSLHAWHSKARLFGHSAPARYMETVISASGQASWHWRTVSFSRATGTTLDLDSLYDDFRTGDRVLIAARTGDGTPIAQIRTVAGVSQQQAQLLGNGASSPAMEATVTRLTLTSAASAIQDIRQAVVYRLAPTAVAFWPYAYASNYTGDAASGAPGNLVYLRGKAPAGLAKERTLILDWGETPLVVTLTKPPVYDASTDHTTLEFSPALPANLSAASMTLFANVVRATHGETVANEILGNGDGAAAFQHFTLKQKPLTHVAQAGAEGGVASTLTLRVDGVAWQIVPDLFSHNGAERVFTLRQVEGDDGEDAPSVVGFGDGESGVKLPTGRKNITAIYRKGLGQPGNLDVGQIRTLLSKPIGLKSVTNPVAAQGGADPEKLDDARQNAPNSVRTFGRIVSLRDFEDVSRSHPSVAKAKAIWHWDGEERAVLLTVAGGQGAVIEPGSTAHANLLADLDSRRDPNRKLTLRPHEDRPLVFQAQVVADGAYVGEAVQTAAAQAVMDHFAFAMRALGKPIHLSDLYAVLHSVDGAIGAKISVLTFAVVHPPTEAGRDAFRQDMRDRGVEVFHIAGRGLVVEPLLSHVPIRPWEVPSLDAANLEITWRPAP